MPAHVAHMSRGSLGRLGLRRSTGPPHLTIWRKETAEEAAGHKMLQGQGDGEEKYFFVVRRTMRAILDFEIMQPRSKHNQICQVLLNVNLQT